LKKTSIQSRKPLKDNGDREEKPATETIAEKSIRTWGTGAMKAEIRRWNSQAPYILLSKWWVNPKGGFERAQFRINNEDQWLRIKRAIDTDFAMNMGWRGYELMEIEKGVAGSAEEYELRLKKKDARLRKESKKVGELQEDVTRLQQMIEKNLNAVHKSRIPQYREDLTEFKRLLRSSKRESELHEFLREHTWIFNPIYISAKSEARIGFTTRSDFLLQRYDGYYDVMELKKSADSIFTKGRLSAKTKNAVSQMIKYLFNTEHYYHILKEYHIDTLKASGTIVIGRTGDEETMKNLRLHNFYLNHMRIISYDELIEVAERSLKTFEVAD